MKSKQEPEHAANDHDDRPAPITDNQIRWFLVRWAVFFVLIAFAAYLITRDIAILASGTIIYIIVTAVYRFYFPQRRK